MKMVTIAPVDKPKSFQGQKFTEELWSEANKVGAMVVPVATALENIRNSKGLYRIVPEKQEVEIRTEIDPDDMTTKELVQLMASFGKAPRKQMTRTAAVNFCKKLLEDAADLIVEDDEE